MPKTLYLAISVWFALFAALSVSAQEYPGCFMLSYSGSLVDLNTLCTDKAANLQPPLVFSSLQSQPILDGAMTQVRGTVTNNSTSVVPLSRIYFQLVANSKILVASAILVDTGSGLNPGESISFDKVLSKSDLGNVPLAAIEVKVTKYE